MPILDDERVMVFIDGSNLYNTVKHLDFDIDYKKLLEFFQSQGRFIRAYYYTALLEHDDYSPIRPLMDWLDYNGYHVVTKPAREYTDRGGHRRIKGNMDIEMALDMLDQAPFVDHIILASGDGDFRAVVQRLQKMGVKVSVLSTRYSTPPMLSDDLKRQADELIELSDLEDEVGRTPKYDSDDGYEYRDS